MRAYAFSHFLLMPLQKGLQSNHAVCRIRSTNEQMLQGVFDDWEKNHTTLIYLNGGFSMNLQAVVDKFTELKVNTPFENFMFPIPWAQFREDHETMEGMRTAVAAVIHPRYYAAISCFRANKDFFSLTAEERKPLLDEAMKYEKKVSETFFWNYTEDEIEFIKFMSTFSLAS